MVRSVMPAAADAEIVAAIVVVIVAIPAAMLGAKGSETSEAASGGKSSADTIDKVDPAYLLRDTRIVAHALWRLLADETLPIDHASQAAALEAELADEIAALESKFDAGAIAVEQSEIKARKSDTEVTDLALVWQPA